MQLKKIISLDFRKAGGLFLITIAASFQLACDKLKVPGNEKEPDEKIVVNINPAVEYQSMHSFGASDCWTTKFVGKWQDEKKKNYIADLLFSLDTLSDGTPQGIGLSLWRFNIGSGSFEQGAASNIADEWRREECFLDEQ